MIFTCIGFNFIRTSKEKQKVILQYINEHKNVDLTIYSVTFTTAAILNGSHFEEFLLPKFLYSSITMYQKNR